MQFSIHSLFCAAALACIHLSAARLQLGAAVRIAHTPSCCCIPHLCAVLARIRRSVARPDLEQLYEIQNKLDKSIARLGKIKVSRCCVSPCCAMPCCAVCLGKIKVGLLRRAALRHVVLCCAVVCCAVLCCAVSGLAVRCGAQGQDPG